MAVNKSAYPFFFVWSCIAFVIALPVYGKLLCNVPTKGIGVPGGVWGYDTSRGRWSTSATIVFYAILTLMAAVGFPIAPRPVKYLGYAAMLVWLGWNILAKPVSHPGPARKRKITREGKWKEPAACPDLDTWRCVVAQESHNITHAANPGDVTLTGEPAGRQIWTQAPSAGPEAATMAQARAFLGVTDFTFDPRQNINSADLPFRVGQVAKWLAAGGALPDEAAPVTPTDAARKAIAFYRMLLCEDGHWGGDYGGPHFLGPAMLVAWHILGRPEAMLTPAHAKAMGHYWRMHQQADGGWGTHIESPSTMFGSVLCYIGLRLSGVQADDPAAVEGRRFIQENGGATYTSSWAKLWLCVLGVMEWEGHNSVPVELWLLPKWFPFHPTRLWCHCRMVYLPMGYLHCSRFVYPQAESDPLIKSLREELYTQPYHTIPWSRTRHLLANMDAYSPIPKLMKLLQEGLAIYELPLFSAMREPIRKLGLQGGWPFSSSAHGWPIGDCTSEGMKSVLRLLQVAHVQEGIADGTLQAIGPDRLQKAVHLLLCLQNPDGGWPSYENNRGYGSWACCFTYAAWFGVEGLMAAGEGPNSESVRKAVHFLLQKQNDNGGWGEDFRSCYDKDYSPGGMKEYGTGGSGVVTTAWALLALMIGECKDVRAVKRGVEYLMREQQPTGDWPQQGISGVFNRSCGITYTAYRNLFPIWALGRYTTTYMKTVGSTVWGVAAPAVQEKDEDIVGKTE